MDAEGAGYLSDALKVNMTLKSLKCAATLYCVCVCVCVCKGFQKRQRPLTLRGCAFICSLDHNFVRAEGAGYISDMLKVNSALKELRLASHAHIGLLFV